MAAVESWDLPAEEVSSGQEDAEPAEMPDSDDHEETASVNTLAGVVTSLSLIPYLICILCKRTTHDPNELAGAKSILLFVYGSSSSANEAM